MHLQEKIAEFFKGKLSETPEDLERLSRDTSIFKRKPALLAAPYDASDLSSLVRFVATEKSRGENLSLTARSAGTDMTGGPLTDSIVVSFTEHMNKVLEVGEDYAVAEPGVFYRDFEKETLAKAGKLLPSFPASREICAIGGIVANNSGGELTLKYGKTERYVRSLDVVLSDGSQVIFGPLSREGLEEKKKGDSLESTIYRDMDALITENAERITNARPKVSKNSSGYALWSVKDANKGTFDLSKLIVGSQGTLALVTKAKLGIVKRESHKAMLVIFLKDLAVLPEVVKRVLAEKPESFESYDNHTFSLAVRFLPQILRSMGLVKAIALGISFLPELYLVLTGGVPKLVLMAEFAESTDVAARDKVRETRHALKELPVVTRMAAGKIGPEKYWKIRRESFNLLRKNVPGLYAAPFIDDCVVLPEVYPQFLPELEALLSQYPFTFTIAGHVGNGNFHIFPLVDMTKDAVHEDIIELNKKVYELVLKYGGSTTGEHNDGIIRTPYVKDMFGPEMYALFEKTKNIFDPQNIFNPGKKVGGTLKYIETHMMHSPR